MKVLHGDCLDVLPTLDAGSVQTCITSPPYWGLRDYGVEGQLGLEKTPEEYVSRMVSVFREVKRVLREDGTLWLNLGDSYASDVKGSGGTNPQVGGGKATILSGQNFGVRRVEHGLKPKDLVGIPWRVAFALQADGWWLRSDVIWSKPNPMPESVTDRPTKAHEYLFLLSRSERYYYDAEAVREPESPATASFRAMRERFMSDPSRHQKIATASAELRSDGVNDRRLQAGLRKSGGDPGDQKRNRRSVWTIATQPFPDAHFAVMPEALVEPCVLAGSKPGDVVLDPFAGSGTVGKVAARHGRKFVGIELNPQYVDMAKRRIAGPLFAAATS